MILANQEPCIPKEEELFFALVRAGEERALTTLPFDLRLFLVDCLGEHLTDPDIVHRVLALDLEAANQKKGAVRREHLKRAGDASLILAGLFPERALRLNVSRRYFRHMGQLFYGTLSVQLSVGPAAEQGVFYNRVAREFPVLEQVLQKARGQSSDDWGAYQRFRTLLN